MKVSYDEAGACLMLSPVEAVDVMTQLTLAGIPFQEDATASAGCAGPEVVLLRLDARDDLQQRVNAALAARPEGT